MVNITFIDADGNSFTVDAAVTSTLMETAIAHEIPSIVGFCGGMCSCGTCHCYPEGEVATRLPAISENEEEMLGRVLDRRPSSHGHGASGRRRFVVASGWPTAPSYRRDRLRHPIIGQRSSRDS